MHYKWLWFSISALLIIPGTVALATWGLQIGIDFRGGSLIELTFKRSAIGDLKPEDLTHQVRGTLENLKLEHLTVQSTGEGSLPAGQAGVLLRTETVNEEQHQAILTALTDRMGETEEVRFELVGPTVSQDLTRKAILAVIVASVTIIAYIAFAFRGVPKPASPWRFGLAAIAALLHDLLFVVGMFAILGRFLGYEVDSLFMTALLTVMGFSVHDTIVVFDRIRENLRRLPSRAFAEITNISLAQTLGRSLATSLTVIFVLLSLFLLGGETTKPFILALLLGITIGTYSSIFNATPLLVVWQEAIDRRRRV